MSDWIASWDDSGNNSTGRGIVTVQDRNSSDNEIAVLKIISTATLASNVYSFSIQSLVDTDFTNADGEESISKNV